MPEFAFHILAFHSSLRIYSGTSHFGNLNLKIKVTEASSPLHESICITSSKRFRLILGCFESYQKISIKNCFLILVFNSKLHNNYTITSRLTEGGVATEGGQNFIHHLQP